MQLRFTVLVLALAMTTSTGAGLKQPADDRPNILLIVVDDMGYSDPSAFGGEIATPNIDSLAARGVRFTNFYVGPNCSVTRSTLMSGHDQPFCRPRHHARDARSEPGRATRLRRLPE